MKYSEVLSCLMVCKGKETKQTKVSLFTFESLTNIKSRVDLLGPFNIENKMIVSKS